MILIPIGTKAQLIKMAPVILEIKDQGIPFDFVLTGQHQETMVDLIEGFGLPEPSYTLAPISEADTPKRLASWLFSILKENLKSDSIVPKKKYSHCLVHGDTMSTLVGALIAKRHRITVAHVEAGLRSHNLMHPFPEEIIRLVVSKTASIFYCSGAEAARNIRKRYDKDIIDIGQNTLLDSVRISLTQKKQPTTNANYCVASIHRFENISKRSRLRFILDTILNISNETKVKFVLHSATRKKLIHYGWLNELDENPRIELIPRMDYFEFTNLISNSRLLISDGGSNQEECSYLNIPCLLMRKKTERSEGLGENSVLSEYKLETINQFIQKTLNKKNPPHIYLKKFEALPSKKIAQDLRERLEQRPHRHKK